MPWLSVMVMDDGARVESYMPSGRDVEWGESQHGYRIRRDDGSTEEFPTMHAVASYLYERYGVDDFGEGPPPVPRPRRTE